MWKGDDGGYPPCALGFLQSRASSLPGHPPTRASSSGQPKADEGRAPGEEQHRQACQAAAEEVHQAQGHGDLPDRDAPSTVADAEDRRT
jgi:hypothetical protein